MVDLGFDIHLRGRAPSAATAEIVRELTEADLALLATERSTKPSHISRISSRHHTLARLLATGMSGTEASACTGYTPSRISILRADPAFEELIAHYTGLKAEASSDLGDRLAALAVEAAEELLDRLDTKPESLATDELNDIVKLGADRSGFGPKSTNVNVNVNLGDRLRAARERAATQPHAGSVAGPAQGSVSHEASPGLLIEGTARRVRDE